MIIYNVNKNQLKKHNIVRSKKSDNLNSELEKILFNRVNDKIKIK